MTLWLSDFNKMSVEPSPSMQGWLKFPTSITEKAKSVCHQVRLQLLKENWQTINGKKVFDREILIFCNEKPAWYAQTLIPEETYACRKEQFSYLKERPIATILFGDPEIVRENFIYAYLSPQNSSYQQAIRYYKMYSHSSSVPLSLWARKSVFRVSGEPLSIMEVFFPDVLPAFPDMLGNQQK